ncbi:MAG: stage 0 sporulation protein [Firmicutes bacterium]|nr:stage 0 sporulation protein [Bacillota bacterium]
MSKIYSVVFKDGGKGYYFKSELNIQENNYVIVETEKGMQLGKVNKVNVKSNDDENLKSIIRIATKKDYEKHQTNLKDSDEALEKCLKLVKKYKLPMNVLNAQFSFDRSQLLFYFTADDRIDFRELAKKLAAIYHTRIELRQVGARDKAKEVGGLGICGQKICCSRFLKHIDSVVINMAKNQNLALNPNKINGVCGRLLCCLSYEDEQYKACMKNLPSLGDNVTINNQEGKVINVNVLERKYTVLINGEKVEVDANGCCAK